MYLNVFLDIIILEARKGIIIMAKFRLRKWVKSVIALIILGIIAMLVIILYKHIPRKNLIDDLKEAQIPEYITVDLIPKGVSHSRNGLYLEDVKNIVIHYVGNPGTSAKNNRDYFANIGTRVNAHFVVGLDGEIIQCIPLYERSCASNHRNKDTISIEVCHPDAVGKFNDKTNESLVKLTAWLCNLCDLDENDVIRHYDVTGKLCPIYYVKNENKWNELLNDIKLEINIS